MFGTTVDCIGISHCQGLSNRIRDTLQTSAEHLFDTGLQHKVHVMKLICFGYDDVFGQRKLLYLVTVILHIVNRSGEFTRGSDRC